MRTTGKIHLIPNLISEDTVSKVIPTELVTEVRRLGNFLVENERNARRYLKKLDREINIDGLRFYSMGKHADDGEQNAALSAVLQGEDLGVISDAGCPGVADPGGAFIAQAHMKNIEVIPHVGPSSILLTLMASGLNGQHFSFHGYLPKDKKERTQYVKRMVSTIRQESSTHLFMDTPFRNEKLFEELMEMLPQDIRLCIGRDVTGANEWIVTRTVAEWKSSRPSIHKIPVIFAVGH